MVTAGLDGEPCAQTNLPWSWPVGAQSVAQKSGVVEEVVGMLSCRALRAPQIHLGSLSEAG